MMISGLGTLCARGKGEDKACRTYFRNGSGLGSTLRVMLPGQRAEGCNQLETAKYSHLMRTTTAVSAKALQRR